MKLSKKLLLIGSMILSSGQYLLGCTTPTLTTSNSHAYTSSIGHMAYSPDGSE